MHRLRCDQTASKNCLEKSTWYLAYKAPGKVIFKMNLYGQSLFLLFLKDYYHYELLTCKKYIVQVSINVKVELLDHRVVA